MRKLVRASEDIISAKRASNVNMGPGTNEEEICLDARNHNKKNREM